MSPDKNMYGDPSESSLDRLRSAWLRSGEGRFEAQWSQLPENPTLRQVQREKQRDLVDWLDSQPGREFLIEAFPELKGFVFPRPAKKQDRLYTAHFLKCRAISDGMARTAGRWEVVGADEIVAPRKSPLIFIVMGIIIGIAVTMALMFFL